MDATVAEQTQQFAEYLTAIAEKFGFTGVHYDAKKEAVVFPATSAGAEQTPNKIRSQPAAFFAFLAGSYAVGAQNITVQSSGEDALLQITGDLKFTPVGGHMPRYLEDRDNVMKKIDAVMKLPNADVIYAQQITQYNKYMAQKAPRQGHLPADHISRTAAEYASGKTPSQANIGPQNPGES